MAVETEASVPAKTYLLVFDQETDRATTTEVVTECPDVFAWVVFADSAAIVCSEKSATELGMYVRKRCPGKWFVIAETVSSNSDGFGPSTMWILIDDPDNGWEKMVGLAAREKDPVDR